jgi:hypothetical protein
VIVGAINVATGEIEYFHSGQPGGLTFEHVAATDEQGNMTAAQSRTFQRIARQGSR